MVIVNSSIASHSVFGEYHSNENQVTAAFLHILERGGEPLLRYVLGVANELIPQNEIIIGTQQSYSPKNAGKSVFDGVITCDFSFTYIIESKIGGNTLTKNQVDKYHQAFEDDNTKLFALTSDVTAPKSLHNGDVWLNWTKLVDALRDYEIENEDDVLLYLIEQFFLLLNNLGLYDEWEKRVIIVGGSYGENVALDYGFYACQNNRYFKRAKYLAFAYRNRIENLFEIIGEPKNDVDISKEPDIHKEYFNKYEPHYKPDMRELFFLKKIKDNLKIQNDNVDKKGRQCAFVQRQTYTTYDRIISAKFTSEL